MAVLKDWRSWHSPEMVLLTSTYTASSLQPLIPSGRPSPKTLVSAVFAARPHPGTVAYRR